MTNQEYWARETEKIIANDKPAVELKYGEHHIKIYARGVMTGAPEGMRLWFNDIIGIKSAAYLDGLEKGRAEANGQDGQPQQPS